MNAEPEFELPLLFTLGSRAVIDELHRQLAARGYADLRPAHGFAFQRLAQGGATGNQLAAFLGITKQAASQMIDELEGRGYVARRPNPDDRRGKIVTLTARGHDSLRESAAILAAIEAEWVAILGAERLAALRADLSRLVAATAGGTMPTQFRPVW
jgi:DNA-binding MarR family transcriptional regulator